MSIPIQSIVLNTDGSWTFSWTDQGASFYRIVLWGNQQALATGTSYTWSGLAYAKYPPPLEIAFENQLVLSEQFLPFLVMQWYGEVAAFYYQVQQLLNGIWTTISTVNETGGWIYTFQTALEADEVTYQYRVIAVDKVGNKAPPRQFQRYVVCPPVPPDGQVSLSYSGGNVVVAAV